MCIPFQQTGDQCQPLEACDLYEKPNQTKKNIKFAQLVMGGGKKLKIMEPVGNKGSQTFLPVNYSVYVLKID